MDKEICNAKRINQNHKGNILFNGEEHPHVIGQDGLDLVGLDGLHDRVGHVFGLQHGVQPWRDPVEHACVNQVRAHQRHLDEVMSVKLQNENIQYL